MDEREIAKMLKHEPSLYVAVGVIRHYADEGGRLGVGGRKFRGADLARELGVVRQTGAKIMQRLKELGVVEDEGGWWKITGEYLNGKK